MGEVGVGQSDGVAWAAVISGGDNATWSSEVTDKALTQMGNGCVTKATY